ncbi:MAG TPA: hypothetical protein VFT52_01395 [Luteimonas sp.]|nr:hypothetical protein [Luteimonas sp.]
MSLANPKPLLLAVALTAALAACKPAAPAADAAADANATAATPAAAESAPAPATDAASTANAADATAAPAAPQLQAAMRDLWHGHIVHARDYALAVHAGDKAGAKSAADAVVANAKDIGNAVGSFYGDAAGAGMLNLLAGHWGAVKAMTDARAKNDKAGADKAMSDLANNAGEIAKFLAGANPNLPEDTVRGLLLAHGAHHSKQIDLIDAGDTAGEAAEWTAMQAHMDMIADALAAAIAKQFPDKAN